MASYEAVLFDFDGVLVDSEPIHWACWCEILQGYGLQLDWETFRDNCIGITDRRMLTFLSAQAAPPIDVDQLFTEYPRKKAMFRERMLHTYTMPGEVVELVASVHRDYKTAVVTSSAHTEVAPILEASGLLPHLDTCVYGNDVSNFKPAPDPYLLAASRLNVKRALVVEDSDAGEASGRAAGFPVLRLRSQADLLPEVRAALAQTLDFNA